MPVEAGVAAVVGAADGAVAQAASPRLSPKAASEVFRVSLTGTSEGTPADQ
jgi:hypothetical protein